MQPALSACAAAQLYVIFKAQPGAADATLILILLYLVLYFKS
jgi:hypothetical protein